jgi:predicted DNA-binding protein YlxM (UPF0122 family)
LSRDFKKNRSDQYQWVLLETPSAPEMITEYSDLQGLRGKLHNIEADEEYYDLKEQLTKEYWRLINEQLTDRQKQVLRLYADGYTQIEIAKMLNVNQSSITKSINGNCDYKNGKRNYGGSAKKLNKLAHLDEKIQEILKKMAEIKQDE